MLTWRNLYGHKKSIFNIVYDNCILCVFDVETTGLNLSTSKIIQFSAARYTVNIGKKITFQYIDSINLFIYPKEKLSQKITELTGITDEILSDKPDESVVVDDIISYLNSADVWAAYNKPFDIGMIDQMCLRNNELLTYKSSLDVLEMARDMCDQSVMSDYKLETISEYVFPEESYNFHDSSEDIKATAMLCEKFLNDYLEVDDDVGKTPVHLERANVFINPKKESQQRIRLIIAGDYPVGCIYYDIVKKCWSCRSDTASKRLFKQCDMQDLERQFIEMYAYRYNNSIDELAKAWIKYKRQVNK